MTSPSFVQSLDQAKLRYLHEQRFQQVVKLLQRTWPNIHLKVVDTYSSSKVIGVIIDETFLPIITVELMDDINDFEIYDHIMNYLNKLKKVKRDIAMTKLLEVQ